MSNHYLIISLLHYILHARRFKIIKLSRCDSINFVLFFYRLDTFYIWFITSNNI